MSIVENESASIECEDDLSPAVQVQVLNGPKRVGSFPLRLPLSTRREAADLAFVEGVSLNQFIVQAVAEKITRLSYSRRESQPNHGPAQTTPATDLNLR